MIFTLLVAGAGYLIVDLRQATRNKQAKMDQDEKAQRLADENAAAQKKIKAEADAAAEKLRQDQADYFFQQTKKNEDLTREIGALTQYKATTEQELIRLRDAKNEADRSITQLTGDLKNRSEANEETKAQNHALVQQNTALMEERQQLLNERASDRIQIQTLTGRVDAMQAELNTLKAEHHRQREEWAIAEIPRQRENAYLRFALREVRKQLTPDQLAVIDAALAERRTSLDALTTSDPLILPTALTDSSPDGAANREIIDAAKTEQPTVEPTK